MPQEQYRLRQELHEHSSTELLFRLILFVDRHYSIYRLIVLCMHNCRLEITQLAIVHNICVHRKLPATTTPTAGSGHEPVSICLLLVVLETCAQRRHGLTISAVIYT